MNKCSTYNDLVARIFDFNISGFDELALDVFHFQYENNIIYRQFSDAVGIDPEKVKTLFQIPFLPISFFKSHAVQSTRFKPDIVFESSGTTRSTPSKHYLKDAMVYTKNFLKGFEQFYGTPEDWCIIGLLPSYLERQHSSLVMMADELIRRSKHQRSGFYLDQYGKLADTLRYLEQQQQRTLLIGVTFALLDFAEQYPLPLKHTVVMETGGMKGRKAEITRQEVHDCLKEAFRLPVVHSEYGMTELLSQAYSKKDGLFYCTDRMKVQLRPEDDPLGLQMPSVKGVQGVINVIDLANISSCSFIATEDAGKLYPDGSFEILGRIDNSDIRGCSLMMV